MNSIFCLALGPAMAATESYAAPETLSLNTGPGVHGLDHELRERQNHD
jgi:hypothetical protein